MNSGHEDDSSRDYRLFYILRRFSTISYGSVYIENDIKQLKNAGWSPDDIDMEIAIRINRRYPDISIERARKIATKTRLGRKITKADWR